MYDYNSIVKDSELKMMFEKISPEYLIAHPVADSSLTVGSINISGGTFEASDDQVFMQYKLWMTRPERKVGQLVSIDDVRLSDLIDEYEELLIGAYIIYAKKRWPEITVERLLPNIKSAIDWLRSTDFYSAPASTIYHESYPGGLLVHSLKVYNQSVKLLSASQFKSVSPEDATFASLVHDWCKIGFYESYEKNVKDDITGEWKKVTAYKKDVKGITLGHGATSMYLATGCFNLPIEVAIAIRWHQGRWNCCREEMDELQHCNETYPIVHLIQFADQLSITKYAN